MIAPPWLMRIFRSMQGLMKKTGGFSDAALAKAEADTRHFLAGISKILKANHGGPWLYGAKPTILDSTLGVFVARLHDVPRTYLLPDEIDQFMQPHLKAAEWQKGSSNDVFRILARSDLVNR